MRRFLALGLVTLLLSACGQERDRSITDLPIQEPEVPEEPDTQPVTSEDLFDGSPGASTDNPYFFFLKPIIASPTYSGVAEEGLTPVVSICPKVSWSSETEACGAGTEIARFSHNAQNASDQVTETPGTGYQVTWQTSSYAPRPGVVYRVSVTVVGQLLGYVDVLAFRGDASCEEGSRDQRECETRPYDSTQGHAAFYYQGSLEIAFRVEEGAIESEYCDPTNLEDCDVELFTYDNGGCLRVFENPGQAGEILGSQACVPSGAAELEGEPVEGAYAVILTLEKEETSQGDGSGYGQVPFFSDLRTDPPGIVFDSESDGIRLVVCQAAEGEGTIPEEFHPWLRPFLIFADGAVSLPQTYSYGAPECEGYGPHPHTAASGSEAGGTRGFLGRFTSGLSRVSQFLLPQPLHAFRLHGGLNTTVYNTRGNRDTEGEGEGDNTPGFSSDELDPQEEDFVVELGAVLDVDPALSSADVPGEGQVGEETTVVIDALDRRGEPFPFGLPVSMEVSGANPGTFTGELVGLGRYEVVYTPTNPGTDEFQVEIEGALLPESYFSTISPVAASPEKTTFQLSSSRVGTPTRVTVSVLDLNGDPYLHGADFPVPVEIEITSRASGETVHLLSAEDDNGLGDYDGAYVGMFTPSTYGTFDVSVSVAGTPTGDSPRNVVSNPLPADPQRSTAEVSEAVVGEPTFVSVLVYNTIGASYTYSDYRSISVDVQVTGANNASFSATDPDLDGEFSGFYIPALPGSDNITVSIDGEPIPGELTTEVDAQAGPLSVTLEVEGGAPSDGLTVEVWRIGGTRPVATRETDSNGQVTFGALSFGPYLVHLPEVDFDVLIASSTLEVTHGAGGQDVTFQGVTQALPDGVVVWRIRDGGTGHAYGYVEKTSGWSGAVDEAQATPLLGVTGHLVSITTPEENDLVSGFFQESGELCQEAGECMDMAWIGASDILREGRFSWITDEPFEFTRWRGGRRPVDTSGNADFVWMDAAGFWVPGFSFDPPSGAAPQGVVNGVEEVGGYFVEWEVEGPEGPPTT